MKKHLLICSLCFGAMLNAVHAKDYNSYKSKVSSIRAWWGTSRDKAIEVTDKFQYCLGQTYCGVNPTVGDLSDPHPGARKHLSVEVKCIRNDGYRHDGGFGFSVPHVYENTRWYVEC